MYLFSNLFRTCTFYEFILFLLNVLALCQTVNLVSYFEIHLSHMTNSVSWLTKIFRIFLLPSYICKNYCRCGSFSSIACNNPVFNSTVLPATTGRHSSPWSFASQVSNQSSQFPVSYSPAGSHRSHQPCKISLIFLVATIIFPIL